MDYFIIAIIIILNNSLRKLLYVYFESISSLVVLLDNFLVSPFFWLAIIYTTTWFRRGKKRKKKTILNIFTDNVRKCIYNVYPSRLLYFKLCLTVFSLKTLLNNHQSGLTFLWVAKQIMLIYAMQPSLQLPFWGKNSFYGFFKMNLKKTLLHYQ